MGGLAATCLFGQVLRLPPVVLAPAIAVITAVGVFAVNNSVFDLGVLFAIGLGDPAVLVANPTSWAVIALTPLVLASPWLRRRRARAVSR